MPRGDKTHYTQKQERQAEHIQEGFEERGHDPKDAEGRAWAVVNAIHKGGELKGGSGYGKPDKAVYRKGGKLGGRAPKKRAAAGRKTRKGPTGRP